MYLYRFFLKVVWFKKKLHFATGEKKELHKIFALSISRALNLECWIRIKRKSEESLSAPPSATHSPINPSALRPLTTFLLYWCKSLQKYKQSMIEENGRQGKKVRTKASIYFDTIYVCIWPGVCAVLVLKSKVAKIGLFIARALHFN